MENDNSNNENSSSENTLKKIFLNIVNESTIKYWKWKINERKHLV